MQVKVYWFQVLENILFNQKTKTAAPYRNRSKLGKVFVNATDGAFCLETNNTLYY